MISLNIKQELNSWAYTQLTNAGFNNVNLSEAMAQYYDVSLRLIAPKPRKIEKSKEFTCPTGYEKKLKFFENAVTSGMDLRPFMTKTMLDASFQDKLLFDWGI